MGSESNSRAFEFEIRGRPEESATGVRTPPPPFDLVAFAQDSESRIRASAEASKRPTGPPPPYHPSRHPQGRLPSFDALPRSVETALMDCARRSEIVRAQLRVGGLSRCEAARAIRAELSRIKEEGESASVAAVRAMASALGDAIGELAGVAEDVRSEQHVLVLEDDVIVRDRVTIAVETLGFRARAAAGIEALNELVHAAPNAVLVGGGSGNAGAGWEALRAVLPLEGIPLIVGGRVTGPGLEAMVRAAGADDYLRFDLPLHDLIDELDAIFTALGVSTGVAPPRLVCGEP